MGAARAVPVELCGQYPANAEIARRVPASKRRQIRARHRSTEKKFVQHGGIINLRDATAAIVGTGSGLQSFDFTNTDFLHVFFLLSLVYKSKSSCLSAANRMR